MNIPAEGRVHAVDSLSPDDLALRTDLGPETPVAATDRIWAAVEHWYAAGVQPGIQLCIRLDGDVVLNRAIGIGVGDDQLTVDTPVCIFSAAKAIAAAAVLRLYETGDLAPDTRVADLLPGYEAHGKGRTTVDHVMTHRAGVPLPTSGAVDLKQCSDSAYLREFLSDLRPVYPPGTLHMYHALTWAPLVREIVHAATGRSIRDVADDEILRPLGFRWTNFGVAPSDVGAVAPSHVTGPPMPAWQEAVFTRAVGGGMSSIIRQANTAGFLTDVIPSSNGVSTAFELSRFAEMLRRGGELDGVRVLQSSSLDYARKQRRSLRPDVATGGVPLRWGTGFMLGSNRFGPFGRRAPEAFGHTGLTQIALWADSERRLSVGVISTGKPSSHPEAGRYTALLDTITASFPRRR